MSDSANDFNSLSDTRLFFWAVFFVPSHARKIKWLANAHKLAKALRCPYSSFHRNIIAAVYPKGDVFVT
jgi:hypothetical protein